MTSLKAIPKYMIWRNTPTFTNTIKIYKSQSKIAKVLHCPTSKLFPRSRISRTVTSSALWKRLLKTIHIRNLTMCHMGIKWYKKLCIFWMAMKISSKGSFGANLWRNSKNYSKTINTLLLITINYHMSSNSLTIILAWAMQIWERSSEWWLIRQLSKDSQMLWHRESSANWNAF